MPLGVLVFISQLILRRKIGPEELEVFGLKEFLQTLAPDVDSALVDQRLMEGAETIAGRFGQGSLGLGLQWLSVLDHEEACAIVQGSRNISRKLQERLRVSLGR